MLGEHNAMESSTLEPDIVLVNKYTMSLRGI